MSGFFFVTCVSLLGRQEVMINLLGGDGDTHTDLIVEDTAQVIVTILR